MSNFLNIAINVIINNINCSIDCPLVAFIRPHLTEHIPVVSLPVSPGQLINPGAHLIIGKSIQTNIGSRLFQRCSIHFCSQISFEIFKL